MTTLEPELLLSQSDWLRGLALGLLRDPERAEDAAQEAMARALERPPVVAGDVGRLRAWFARVLRNRDISSRRGDTRRAAREESVARADHVPAVSVGIERAELSRNVVEAVLELPADLRDVVLLRFFEDLPPREIARRLGLPGTTVRSRLQKALARLRERLDRRYGERDAWAVALSAVCAESTRVGTVGAALAVTVALALVVGGVAWVGADSPAPEAIDPLVATVPQDLAERGDRGPAGSPNGAERRRARPTASAIEPTQDASVSSAVAAGLRVAARFIDETGRPLAGGRLAVAGVGQPQSEPTERDGRATLTLPADVRTTNWLTAWAPGRVQKLVSLEAVHSANDSEVDEYYLGDVVLGPGGSVTGRVLDEEGLPVANAWVEACSALASDDPEERLAFGRTIGLSAAWVTIPRTDAEGFYRIDGLPPGRATFLGRAHGRLCDWHEQVPIEVSQVTTLRTLYLRTPGPGRTLAGRVLGANGDPLVRTRTWLTDVDGERLGDLDRTDGEGYFSFTAPAGRDLWLAFGSMQGAQRYGPVRAGARELLVQLREPDWVTVTIQDQNRRAFERSWLRFVDTEGERLPVRVATDDAEQVRFARPSQPFLLVAGAAGARAVELGPFDPALVSSELAVQLERGPVIAGVVRAPGRSVADLEVVALPRHEPGPIGLLEGDFHTRVSTSGRQTAKTDSTGRFSIGLAEAGEYIVVARVRPGVFARTELLSVGQAGLDELELVIAPTGALEGRVSIASGVAVEGTIVAVSSGIANVVTTRTDALGNYRFAELAPGPWQVRTIRSDRLSVVVQAREKRTDEELTELPWDVAVESNAVAHFDLDCTADRPFAFGGRLTFGDRPPVGWNGIARGQNEIHPLALDARGRFRIRLAEEGRLSLSFWGPDHDGVQAFVYGLIDVDRRSPEWSLDLPVASLDVTGLPPAEPFTDTRAYEIERGFDHALDWTGAGGWRWHAELSAVIGGSVRIEDVPVGRIAVRHRRSEDRARQFGTWPILAEIELERDQDALLRID